MSFKYRTLRALMVATGLAAAMVLSPMTGKAAETPAPAAAGLDKAAVEKIIHDYLMNNATVIMDSVEQYQRKTMREKSSEAIKSNTVYLFQDDDAPFIGNAAGDVKIVEFFDYNCGYCKKVLPELQDLVAKDPNVKILFKDFPILGPTSETSAKWALAAHMQKKYFSFHKIVMEHKGPINDEVLEKAAKDAGLDVDKAKKDVEGTDIMMQIEKNRALAGQLGITGTPAFVIGEDIVPGAIPVDEIQKMVNEARKKKG